MLWILFDIGIGTKVFCLYHPVKQQKQEKQRQTKQKQETKTKQNKNKTKYFNDIGSK